MAIQPGVLNLSVRMLVNREEALDATQEIVLKVVASLIGFRKLAGFTTWVIESVRSCGEDKAHPNGRPNVHPATSPFVCHLSKARPVSPHQPSIYAVPVSDLALGEPV